MLTAWETLTPMSSSSLNVCSRMPFFLPLEIKCTMLMIPIIAEKIGVDPEAIKKQVRICNIPPPGGIVYLLRMIVYYQVSASSISLLWWDIMKILQLCKAGIPPCFCRVTLHHRCGSYPLLGHYLGRISLLIREKCTLHVLIININYLRYIEVSSLIDEVSRFICVVTIGETLVLWTFFNSIENVSSEVGGLMTHFSGYCCRVTFRL